MKRFRACLAGSLGGAPLEEREPFREIIIYSFAKTALALLLFNSNKA